MRDLKDHKQQCDALRMIIGDFNYILSEEARIEKAKISYVK